MRKYLTDLFHKPSFSVCSVTAGCAALINVRGPARILLLFGNNISIRKVIWKIAHSDKMPALRLFDTFNIWDLISFGWKQTIAQVLRRRSKLGSKYLHLEFVGKIKICTKIYIVIEKLKLKTSAFQTRGNSYF